MDYVRNPHLSKFSRKTKYFEYISDNELDLNRWLCLLEEDSPDIAFTNVCFPTKEIAEEYFSTINARSNEEVVRLLLNFLITSGSLGLTDEMNLTYFESIKKDDPQFDVLCGREYYRRLLRYSFGISQIPPWEGITWIVDLLPYEPRQALAALDAYMTAHLQLLPDPRFDGLLDAAKIIRAKFIGTPDTKSEAIQFLLNLKPRDFEILINKLYIKMGYKTVLTPPQKDGGRDIKANRDTVGNSERLLIECKRYNNTVGVEYVRSLLGVVKDEKANKGVLIATGRFSKEARLFGERNSMELISGGQLVVLLNEYLGSDWSLNIERLIRTTNFG
jgi:restriction system protein